MRRKLLAGLIAGMTMAIAPAADATTVKLTCSPASPTR